MSFPTNPSNDQTYVTNLGTCYKYVSADTAWKIVGVSGTSGGSGTVLGTGTANYIPKWSDSSTLTNSATIEIINTATSPSNGFTRRDPVFHSADSGILNPQTEMVIANVSGYNDGYIVAHGHVFASDTGGSFSSSQAVFLSSWNSIGFISSEGSIKTESTPNAICVINNGQSISLLNATDSTIIIGYDVTYFSNSTV